MKKSLLSIFSILALSVFSCQKGDSKEQHIKTEVTPNIQTPDDSLLVNLTKTFSADVGEDGQKAFEELRSRRRSDLINDLSRLRSSLPSNDSLQPQIAFVFCHLDQEYKANADVVASALSRTQKFRDFHGDQAASMVARLVKRGDKSLMPVLFGSVSWADGALAEQLGFSLADELASDTKAFLEALGDQPRDIRLKSYELIDNADKLSVAEKKSIGMYLHKINGESKFYRVAREILASHVLN